MAAMNMNQEQFKQLIREEDVYKRQALVPPMPMRWSS